MRRISIFIVFSMVFFVSTSVLAITSMRSVSFSPDGSLVASGSKDGTIRIWDVKTRVMVGAFRCPGWVFSISFSPDGSLLASGGENSTVKLWDVKTRTLLATIEHPDWVFEISFSPDGSLIASECADAKVRLWDVKAKTLVSAIENSGFGAFSPDGSLLATVSGDTISLRDKNGAVVATIQQPKGVSASSLAFSPDGSLLAIGSREVAVRLWDVKTKALIAGFSHFSDMTGKYSATSLVFSPDGSLLANGSADFIGGTTIPVIEVWDVKAKKLVTTLEDAATSLAFSPDGSLLAAGGYGVGYDDVVDLRDTKTWKLVATLEAPLGQPVNPGSGKLVGTWGAVKNTP